jgi:release factor glutamine methyltransferase
VFVPRRRTEYLAELAAGLAEPGACVVDLCCGTGAVGLAIASQVGAIELHAVDVDPQAADCARANLAPVGGTAYCGNLFSPLPARLRRAVDLVVANAPYVPTEQIATMPAEARLHEPRIALDGGGDGLGVQRQIIIAAPRWLRPGGALLIEASASSGPAVATAMREVHLTAQVHTDQGREATVVIGRG